ncbi:hypothetical protein ACFLY7_00005, partial [Patescibacteria group bacterium]
TTDGFNLGPNKKTLAEKKEVKFIKKELLPMVRRVVGFKKKTLIKMGVVTKMKGGGGISPAQWSYYNHTYSFNLNE